MLPGLANRVNHFKGVYLGPDRLRLEEIMCTEGDFRSELLRQTLLNYWLNLGQVLNCDGEIRKILCKYYGSMASGTTKLINC